MPSVFTLEGPDLDAYDYGAYDSGMPIYYPQWGVPISPHGAPIGPARVPTPVFGPGGTPVMYRRSYPARGPVCDYCDPNQYTTLGGFVEAFQAQGSGIVTAGIIGGAALSGVLLGGLAIWIGNRVRRRRAATP